MKLLKYVILMLVLVGSAYADPTPTPSPTPHVEMKELLTQKSAELFNWIQQAAKDVGSFTAQQTPLFIKELLAWNFWYNLTFFALSLFLIFVAFVLLKRVILDNSDGGWSVKQVHYGNTPANPIGLTKKIIASVLTAISIITFFFWFNLEWLKIMVAPRVWLVEYAKTLVK